MANKALQAIKDGIGDLTHLEVLTVVGDFELDEAMLDITPESITSSDKIFSRVGLVDGDIKTAMSPIFVTDAAYKDMWTFHESQVAKGQQIIKDNIAALRELVTFIEEKLNQDDSSSS